MVEVANGKRGNKVQRIPTAPPPTTRIFSCLAFAFDSENGVVRREEESSHPIFVNA